MSPFIQRAEEMSARFRSLTMLDGVDVIVDRQKDIRADLAKIPGKAKGMLVAILWVGAKRVENDPLVMDAMYEVRIYSKPIIRGEQTPADEIIAEMMASLHEWQADIDGLPDDEFRITGDLDLIPDASFLFYFFPVTARVILNAPTFNQ